MKRKIKVSEWHIKYIDISIRNFHKYINVHTYKNRIEYQKHSISSTTISRVEVEIKKWVIKLEK